MRRSSLRLVVLSVLACWAVTFVVLILYARSQSWTEDNVRRGGVFLAYELLEQTPRLDRAARLRSLHEHVAVDLALISLDDLERRIGRPGVPGQGIAYRMSVRHSWYFLVFDDGSGALAAGPVNPMRPSGVVPIGLLLAVVLLPVIAGAVAFRLSRKVRKVERANQALAVGDLSVRVHDDNGPADELAASFNAMAERVEVLIRSRDELVQAVSHELGSPLSRLRFHVELLESRSEVRHTERIQAMARELDALDELVAELLSCVQSDDLELDCQNFDPTLGLADLAELVRYEAPDDRAVDVELKIALGTHVFADKRLFLRAIENLLRNAIRHANHKVLLELTKEKNQICVAVHDDGPGIPEALREKVMAPFFRLQAERSRKTGGLGLGLAIVDRITQRHGGHVVITTSSLGGATVATVWSSSVQ
jgi:two-component system sensor kinase ParS